MRKLKSILQSRYLFKILVIIFIIYALLVTNFYEFKSKYDDSINLVNGVVNKKIIDGDKLTIYLKAKDMLIINYYIKSEGEKEYFLKEIHLGDKLMVEGELYKASNNTVPNLFNYKKYLYYNKIYYLVKANNIQKISNGDNIFYYIKNKINDRIEKIDRSGYLKIFILGDKNDIEKNVMDSYRVNGVSHLFSISGMHISLIAGIILFVLKKMSYNNKFNYLIVILFLILYLFLTGCSPSILRATIMFILMGINKCYNLKIKNIDVMLFVLVLVIVINPFYIYNVGFQFSYLISFTLIMFSNKIISVKGKIKQSLYISWICFLVSFPIAIYNFYQVNILSIFLNIVLIPMVSIIIYPLSLLSFFIPILINIFYIMINILELINNVLSKIDIGQVVFLKPSLFLILVYYIFIYLGIINKKYLLIFLLIVIIHKSFIYFDGELSMMLMDVGQGDCIFFKLPNNNGNILIDTGGNINYSKDNWARRDKNYNMASSKIIPYLKSKSIRNLDFLIITHGDYDHMGEAVNLVNNFKVDKVIFNCGEYNDLERELIKVLDKKNIKYYSCIKELNIDKYKLKILNTKEYDNENDNSNVIYFNYNNYKFLFMGDAGVKREKDILDKYNLKDINFLKIGHHGSNTSSSEYFINSISPKYSLISVGKNNRYGHPQKSVLDSLKYSKIYRTDLDGSIEIKLNKNGYQIKTCLS